MKTQLLVSLAAVAVLGSASAQTAGSFVNDTILVCPPATPPQIDATNFINNSVFIVDTLSSLPYSTANTENYTNYGTMAATSGFRFDTWNTKAARYRQARSFHNEANAVLNAGGSEFNGYYDTTNDFIFTIFGSGAQCIISAADVVNRGMIDLGIDSVMTMEGNNVNLSGGLIYMEGFEQGGIFDGGFSGHWGLGQVESTPSADFGFLNASSPLHWVTNRDYADLQNAVFAGPATAYLNVVQTGPSNLLVQVVYLQNFNPAISNNVYFGGRQIAVEWQWQYTNLITGLPANDYLYLADNLIINTNMMLKENGLATAATGFRPAYMPTNYVFFRGTRLINGTPAAPGLPPGIFPPGNLTNDYTAYQAIFSPTTRIPYELAGQTYSNMPGRIEIKANGNLDLTTSRLSGLNFLRLNATNNFEMDLATRIVTPVADYSLGVTNQSSTLVASNLLAPVCPRLNGTIDLYSARWVTVDAQNVTNTFHVLVVDSQLQDTTPSSLLNLSLRASNVVVSDVLNVLSNLTVDAVNLTVTTNGPDSQTPRGELNLLSGRILWTNSFPRLQNLTNDGVISLQNAAFFGGVRYPPYYPNGRVEPYRSFINRGTISTHGCFIWADTFLNTGFIDGGLASVQVQARQAEFQQGFVEANGDIVLAAHDLLIAQQSLNAGRKLVFWATNSLDDGGALSLNFFNTGSGGLSLPRRPATRASLLGTTIRDTSADWAITAIDWAAEDRGASPAGYDNNAAIGQLTLNGGWNSKFRFLAPAGNNALYVDRLELTGFSTNRNANGDLVGLEFGPGMKLYFADAYMNGVSVAEKINHKNNGGLNWVSSYAGSFTSTNMVYPDGSTNVLNLALVTSCNLDSDNDGIVNCSDPTPVFLPSMYELRAAVSRQTTATGTELTWQTTANSTNTVYYKSSLASTNWLVLTNFVYGPFNGQASVLDPMTASTRYYRVRVDVRQP